MLTQFFSLLTLYFSMVCLSHQTFSTFYAFRFVSLFPLQLLGFAYYLEITLNVYKPHSWLILFL